jgi:hypothetical protein
MSKAIKTAQAAVRAAQKKEFEEYQNTFPVGTVVNFERGGHVITAEILEWRGPYYINVLIENLKTGRVYGLCASWLLHEVS